jgi:predicted short-subunit dehydrogenase-like oxidoreductase (DUF2520 family)
MSSGDHTQTTDAVCLGGSSRPLPAAVRHGDGLAARHGGRAARPARPASTGIDRRDRRDRRRGLDFRGAAGYCRTVPAANTPPLAGLRFSLVGPGRVGASLAAWAVAAGAELARSAGSAALRELASEGQDLLLIAVPDGALAEVAAQLAARPQAAVVLHASGSRGAAVLAPLRATGSAAGALHPLKAFPRPLPDIGQARGVFFALDGDPAAVRLARRLVAAWDGVAGEVPEAARPLYHLAATLAAGGVATLLDTARDLAAGIGLPPEVARGYLELARGTVAAAIEASPAAPPLTGPVARGDAATFALLVAALRQADRERVPLVLALARETLRLAGRDPGHPDLRQLLAWVEAQSAPKSDEERGP